MTQYKSVEQVLGDVLKKQISGMRGVKAITFKNNGKRYKVWGRRLDRDGKNPTYSIIVKQLENQSKGE